MSGEGDPEPADRTDPTEPAEDGMAPIITNTGDDDAGGGDDADAPTG